MPADGRVWFQELFDNYEITGGPVKEIKHFQGTSRYLDLPQGGTLTITYLGRPLPRPSWTARERPSTPASLPPPTSPRPRTSFRR